MRRFIWILCTLLLSNSLYLDANMRTSSILFRWRREHSPGTCRAAVACLKWITENEWTLTWSRCACSISCSCSFRLIDLLRTWLLLVELRESVLYRFWSGPDHPSVRSGGGKDRSSFCRWRFIDTVQISVYVWHTSSGASKGAKVIVRHDFT